MSFCLEKWWYYRTHDGLIAEISRVRGNVLSFTGDNDGLDLPEAVGPVVTLSEKLTIPVKEHPEVRTSVVQSSSTQRHTSTIQHFTTLTV